MYHMEVVAAVVLTGTAFRPAHNAFYYLSEPVAAIDSGRGKRPLFKDTRNCPAFTHAGLHLNP